MNRQPSPTDEEGPVVEAGPSDMEAVGSAALEQYGSRTKLGAIGLVTSAVIRDFNDPLQAIGNILGGIQRRGSVEAEDLNLVTLAYEELQKLNAMVRELQEFCQPGREYRELVDMAAEVDHYVKTTTAVFAGRHITVKAETERGLPPVHAEARLIRWVLEELFAKLASSCDEGAALHLRFFADDGAVVLQISEKGCGLDQEAMERFTEVFSNGGKQDIACFWLTICSAIVVMHDGSLKVGSADGSGTVVRVRLPVAPPPASSE